MDLAKTIDKKSMIGLTDPRFNKITDTQMQTIETLLGGRIVVKGISYKITNAGGTFALEESGTLAAKLWQSTPSLFKANIVLSDSTKLHFEEMKTLSNKDFAGQLLNELSADRKAVLIATLKGEAGNSLAIGEHAFSVEEKAQLLALLEG